MRVLYGERSAETIRVRISLIHGYTCEIIDNHHVAV